MNRISAWLAALLLALGLLAPAQAANEREIEAQIRDEIARVSPTDGVLDLSLILTARYSALWVLAPYADLDRLGAAPAVIAAARATGIDERDDIVALILADGLAVETVIAFSRRAGDFTPAARSRPYSPAEAVFQVCRSRYLDGHSPEVKPSRESCL